LTFARPGATIAAMSWNVAGVRAGAFLMAALALIAATGCNEDDSVGDEPTPEGKGALVVDNHTADTLSVFVGGVHTAAVAAVSQTEVALSPGLYRVVVDQDEGPRSFRDDVDILRGRRTWLHVDYGATGAVTYAVAMEFD
jgi:hypothetical protein